VASVVEAIPSPGLGALDALLSRIGELQNGRDPRMLLTAGQAAKELGVDPKLFRESIAKKLPTVILDGCTRPRYMLSDLWAYLDKKRKEPSPCPSTSRKGRRSGTTISGSRVIAISEVLAQRKGRKR
jgi:hypothetical protein